MGIYDRDYSQQGYRPGGQYFGGGQVRMGFPSLTPGVKWLIIANVVIFLLSSVRPVGNFLVSNFAVLGVEGSFSYAVQIWRYITYQFLHAGIMHILLNMLGLFFLGTTLERHWGTSRFIKFYLICGSVGGILYSLLSYIGFFGAPAGAIPLVGASGGVLGLLAVCAIKFPHFVVFFMFFPVPIRVAAIILIIIYVFNLVGRGTNAGGDAAHLAGMAAGAVYVWWPKISFFHKLREKKRRDEQELLRTIHSDVDRILDKVSKHGITSLTRNEKKILQKATKMEQMNK